ncbi:MAG: prepilin-type N-terminal cleavage/methylation domain-containing protein [Gammaproteobacteria bacterium]
MQNPIKKGFSLMELMVAVSILAVLVGLGYNQYKENLIKAKYLDILAVAESYKPIVTELYSRGINVTTPSCNDPLIYQYIPSPPSIDSANTALQNAGWWWYGNCAVQVDFNAQKLGLPGALPGDYVGLTLRPFPDPVNGELLRWRCDIYTSFGGGTAAFLQYIPKKCQWLCSGCPYSD